MDIILATNNAHKVQELRRMLEPLGYTLYSQKEKGISIEVEENGTTFEENAFLKAKAIYDLTGCAALADDSGLCVDALSGAPGVYSARYAGEPCDDKKNNEKLLKAMDGVENRAAQFVSVICCAFPDGGEVMARGECPGILAQGPSGDGGFGYDPIFYLPQLGKTMAQLTPAEKNQISHRARALAGFQKEWERQRHGTDQ